MNQLHREQQHTPKVSIGMPVYNGEKYIREALDSLLAQTFTDFELIISDNASTDATEAICREYAARDPRLRYVRQSENGGGTANFQFVLDEAVGEYFMWAAFDDLWGNHCLDHALRRINSMDVGFAFPTFVLRSIYLKISMKMPKNIFSCIEDIDRNRRLLGFANLHHLSHKCNIVYSLFRTEVIRAVCAIQDISNDGLMAMVLLGMTRGVIVDGFHFSKRYEIVWPGFGRAFLNLANRTCSKDFSIIRDRSFATAKSLFPELSKSLDEIRVAYDPQRFCSNYRIINRSAASWENHERGSMLPTVSIGMPVYNGTKYIREALDSLLAQTFRDFELIVSDNASTDDTESICREYASRDTRIRYVRQSENMGPIKNFQFVLDEAKGEYFMWAAADDVWDVKYIETLLPVSSVYQCLAYGFVQQIGANGKRMMHPANYRKFEFTGNRFIRRLKYYMEPGVLGKANPIYGIFPIITLRAIGLSCLESGKSGGDMIFLYVLLDRMEIRHAGPVYLYKRIHNDCVVVGGGGGGVTQEIEKPSVLAKLIAFLRGAVHGPMLGQYIKRSSSIGSVFLAFFYPICVVLLAGYLFFYKMHKILKMSFDCYES